MHLAMQTKRSHFGRKPLRFRLFQMSAMCRQKPVDLSLTARFTATYVVRVLRMV